MTTLFVSASNVAGRPDEPGRGAAGTRGSRSTRCAARSTARSAVTAGHVLVAARSRSPGYCQNAGTTLRRRSRWCAVGGRRRTRSGATRRRVLRHRREKAESTSPPTRSSPAPRDRLRRRRCTGLRPAALGRDVRLRRHRGRRSGDETSGRREHHVRDATTRTGHGQLACARGSGSYNVYGRDDGSTTVDGLRLLAITTTTSRTSTPAPRSRPWPPPPLGTSGSRSPVDVTPANASQRYTLADDIVLRNSGERLTCTQGSPPSPSSPASRSGASSTSSRRACRCGARSSSRRPPA